MRAYPYHSTHNSFRHYGRLAGGHDACRFCFETFYPVISLAHIFTRNDFGINEMRFNAGSRHDKLARQEKMKRGLPSSIILHQYSTNKYYHFIAARTLTAPLMGFMLR